MVAPEPEDVPAVSEEPLPPDVPVSPTDVSPEPVDGLELPPDPLEVAVPPDPEPPPPDASPADHQNQYQIIVEITKFDSNMANDHRTSFYLTRPRSLQ